MWIAWAIAASLVLSSNGIPETKTKGIGYPLAF